MKLYVVEALRWGIPEDHSYIVGIFSSKEQAEKVSLAEELYRGGKYKCKIEEHILDHVNEEYTDSEDYANFGFDNIWEEE
jgi:hypothetical protein